MILEALLNLIKTLLETVFGFINLPAFPEELTSSIETFLNLIFENLSLLGFFISKRSTKGRIETSSLFLYNKDRT